MSGRGRGRRVVLRRHAQAAALVARRSALLGALRATLAGQGLLEADVPVLLPHAGQEAHLHAPRVELPGLPGPLYLQTSPELPLKRLVAAGVHSVFALGPAFRGGREELSRVHQPGFTLLEWYRPGTRVEELVDDVGGLVSAAAQALGRPGPGRPQPLTLRAACERWAGFPLDALLDGDLVRFRADAAGAGVGGLRPAADAAELFERVFVERIDPGLARTSGLVVLTGWPACAAALARLDPVDPRLSLRAEAYLHGIEIANGWVELEDGDEVQRRWQAEARSREDAPPPVDDGLIADLRAGLWPPTIGMALGVDRLQMALEGAAALADVRPLSLELEEGAAGA